MKKVIILLTSFMALGIAGYFTYNWMKEKEQKNTEIISEKSEEQQKIAKLEEKVSVLEEELEDKEDTSIAKEKIAQIFGEKKSEIPTPKEKKVSCEELHRKISSLFNYLDEKKYTQTYGLNESTEEFVQKIVNLLTENTPQITGEMQNMPILMKNMAYFYRVLGRKRLEILREIIKNENDIIESGMRVVYQYFKADNQCKATAVNLPPFESVYNYSIFFLNTLAGRNYLLRRSSKIRIITSFYCILIIDRANDESLNQYGFDIRPQVEKLLNDIKDHKRLVHKKYYLEELEKIERKYS
jgi:hypothetical protein